MDRETKITIEPKTGQFFDITVLVDDKAVIQRDGTKKRSWSGKLPETKVPIKIWLVGVVGSRAAISVDLPGTEYDFTVTYTLTASVLILEFAL